jgi:hypothetical protein
MSSRKMHTNVGGFFLSRALNDLAPAQKTPPSPDGVSTLTFFP